MEEIFGTNNRKLYFSSVKSRSKKVTEAFFVYFSYHKYIKYIFPIFSKFCSDSFIYYNEFEVIFCLKVIFNFSEGIIRF